jgi:hypothetical protein
MAPTGPTPEEPDNGSIVKVVRSTDTSDPPAEDGTGILIVEGATTYNCARLDLKKFTHPMIITSDNCYPPPEPKPKKAHVPFYRGLRKYKKR